MAKYILKRVLMAVITLFIVICLTFFLMNAVPGNPWLSEKTPTQATIDALNAKYGLDQPVIVQLGKYLENLIHLDFGPSIKMQKDRPVLDIILTMFPISAGIGAIAIIWAILVGVPLGCLAAYKRGTWVDSLLRVICTLGISMPGFVVATMLLHLLTGGIEGLKLFPTMFDGTAKSYVLPCLALGFYPMCYLSRQTRTAMLDAINQEYIKTARAKGLKNKKIIFKHALRNALIPIVTLVGLQIGSLLGGAVVVEQIFSLPGLGLMTLTGINNRDYPVVQGCVLFIAFVYVLVNLIVDLLYAYIDPRISYD